MKKKLLITLHLLIIILALFFIVLPNFQNSQTKNSSNSTTQQLNYTYFTLDIEWPCTICKQKKCTEEKMGQFDSKNFNLHGLWPSGSSLGSPCQNPFYCSDSSFSFSNIEPSTVKHLKAYWVGLYSDQNWFLNHEWKKHGSCYSKDQNNYFTTTINLHKKYNPVQALDAYGIVPSNENPYQMNHIQSALDKGLNTTVLLKCQKIKGQQYLSSIQLFFDTSFNSLSQSLCSKSKSTCSREFPVYFPTCENIF